MNQYQSTREYFDSLAYKWDEMCSHNPDKIEKILTLANIKTNSRILDIATGTGVLIPHLLAYAPEEIIAIDLSELMIKQAKKNHNQPNVRFEAVNFYEFEQTGFDLAIAYSAYPHFSDKAAFAKQLAVCLKPGGRFVIAHSESRDVINGRHSGDHVSKVSSTLQDAETEAQHYRAAFDIDILVDTNELYIISGRKL
jgi:demethylmenaquinone methyltransferase/2-methoxy-6-polyprenyl-1,4-benzoquinol methylase